MAELALVDTHIHFWDLKHPDLYYSWLQPDFQDTEVGNLDAIKMPLYGADEFLAETRFHNVSKVVHVQAAVGIQDTVKETEWVQTAAERTGFPQAIVAHTSLKGEGVEEELERHSRYPSLRGIRDFSEGDYLVDPNFQRGYALLEKFGLVCDLQCAWDNMWKARDLARTFPNVRMVLDHAGFPQERTTEYLENWKQGILALAEAENAVCKISALGMYDHAWTIESLRPWVLHCIESFGVERTFFGTNWPVDRMYSSYGDVVDAYAELIADFSRDEQVALFSGNAERIYRI